MLPLIDLNPRNERCICSTLLYVTEQAKHLNIELPSTNICELKRLNKSKLRIYTLFFAWWIL